MAGGVTAALLIAFGIGSLIDGTALAWLMPYVDPGVLALVAIVLIPVPFTTLRKAVAEIALVTPPRLREEAEEVAARVVTEQGFDTFRCHVAQVGRAKQVEIIFHVPTGLGPKPLEDWDEIRARVQRQLGQDDPNNWITVMFTTRPLPATT